MSKTIKVNIKGMHCNGCALGLQGKLEQNPSVKSAKVSYPQHSAIVEWDGEEVYEPILRGAVADAGFEVVSFE